MDIFCRGLGNEPLFRVPPAKGLSRDMVDCMDFVDMVDMVDVMDNMDKALC